MRSEIMLQFLDGHKQSGYLSRPFRREKGSVEVIIAADDNSCTFALKELSVIFFLSDQFVPPVISIKEDMDDIEDIEVNNGGTYLVHSEDVDENSSGFFARSAEKETPWRYAFFTTNGIRLRIQKRPLGSIMIGLGLLTQSVLTSALKIQEDLRHRRLGGIIAEKYDIHQETIESTIRDSITLGSLQHNAKIGDILIAAGLVTVAQVRQALAAQETGKKIKIGELLIERGHITEEQLLSALAKKYCLRLVDLEQIIPAPETFAILSKEIVKRLQVFPLASKPRKLVVATSTPTDTSISDKLRFVTNRYIEFAVASKAAIKNAIDRYYSNTN